MQNRGVGMDEEAESESEGIERSTVTWSYFPCLCRWLTKPLESYTSKTSFLPHRKSFTPDYSGLEVGINSRDMEKLQISLDLTANFDVR